MAIVETQLKHSRENEARLVHELAHMHKAHESYQLDHQAFVQEQALGRKELHERLEQQEARARVLEEETQKWKQQMETCVQLLGSGEEFPMLMIEEASKSKMSISILTSKTQSTFTQAQNTSTHHQSALTDITNTTSSRWKQQQQRTIEKWDLPEIPSSFLLMKNGFTLGSPHPTDPAQLQTQQSTLFEPDFVSTWHSRVYRGKRIQVKTQIGKIFNDQFLPNVAGMWADHCLAFWSTKVELVLYQNAPTLAHYEDQTTLYHRIAQVLQKFAAESKTSSSKNPREVFTAYI